MKRAASYILMIATLIVSSNALATSYASKPPVQGAKCSKAKATQTFDGRVYTCKKSKGKLTWSKGVRIKVATPKTSPTPTPTPTPTVSAPANVSPTPTPTPTVTQTRYTLDGVRTNNSASSCWTIIDGFVYDLTKWISAHPGGPSAIRSLCGVDGTASFKAQHQNQANPTQRLSNYLLGPLDK